MAPAERTILVVEDQPEVRALLSDALEMLGYRVLTAAHPDDGLAIAAERAEEIDLVLTDIMMPGMSGPEMAQRLMLRHPFLRILYLSGHGAEALGPLGLTEDSARVLKKPFTMDALLERVSGALTGGEIPASTRA